MNAVCMCVCVCVKGGEKLETRNAECDTMQCAMVGTVSVRPCLPRLSFAARDNRENIFPRSLALSEHEPMTFTQFTSIVSERVCYRFTAILHFMKALSELSSPSAV